MFNQETTELLHDAGLAPLPFDPIPALSTDTARIWLKRDWTDPDGDDPLRTIKRKPACLLVADILQKDYVDANKIAISATSGNLGIEVGLLAAKRGFPFFAVVPGSTPEYNLQVMFELGIHVIRITEMETCPREFTVFFTRGYAHEFPFRLVNVEQYHSWLNPAAHSLTTARELFDGFGGTIDHVVAAVGSCGTISGLIQFAAATRRTANIVGVQPALHHGVPGTHLIQGGCAWTPENYSPAVLPDGTIHTADSVDAYAYTALLWDLGLPAGPSTGMALAQAHKMVRQGATGDLVITSPDSNFKYGDLIADKLDELRPEIVTRYPDLELDRIVPAYVEHLRRHQTLAWTLGRVRDCYPASTRGQLFGVEDIEEIVKNPPASPRVA